MRAVGVIPARFQASRFPGKPLAKIAGMSMIERVWRGTRSAIPYPREAEPRCWQHVGIYAYRREFLLRFPALAPTPAERTEGLEQLRALEHGFAIHCAVIEGWTSAAVDVPGDVEAVEARLAARAAGEPTRAPAKERA